MIPFIDPIKLNKNIQNLKKQVLSGRLGPGKVTSDLEKNIVLKFNSKYALFTTSATMGLYIAVQALGLKKNDEILIPAYGVVCNANAFSSFGLKIKLVDINLTTGCMDIKKLKKQINYKTKAICFVNFSGNLDSDLKRVEKLCKKRKIFLIEDSACGFGNKYKNKFAGTFGDIGIFSFSPAKIITSGQGGLMLFKKNKHYKKASEIIDQGGNNWRLTKNHKRIGLNLRFNDILASYLKYQINNIDEIIRRKKKLYKILSSNLDLYFFGNKSIYSLYNIVFSANRKILINALRKKKIFCMSQYKRINQNSVFSKIQKKEKFNNALFWEKNALFLPSGSNMTNTQAKYINKILKINKKLLIPIK